MKTNKASGPSGIWIEDIRRWHDEFEKLLESIESENEEYFASKIENHPWKILVELIQDIFTSGTIPQKMMWETLIEGDMCVLLDHYATTQSLMAFDWD